MTLGQFKHCILVPMSTIILSRREHDAASEGKMLRFEKQILSNAHASRTRSHSSNLAFRRPHDQLALFIYLDMALAPNTCLGWRTDAKLPTSGWAHELATTLYTELRPYPLHIHQSPTALQPSPDFHQVIYSTFNQRTFTTSTCRISLHRS